VNDKDYYVNDELSYVWAKVVVACFDNTVGMQIRCRPALNSNSEPSNAVHLNAMT
jgi:hypothetical protein